MPDPLLDLVTPRLANVPGVVAVVLGGSRARGTEQPGSDTDIGLYFRGETPLDTGLLLDAVKAFVDEPETAHVTPVGEWGPWIVGGGWLSVSGRKLDLLYRNCDDVARVIRRLPERPRHDGLSAGPSARLLLVDLDGRSRALPPAARPSRRDRRHEGDDLALSRSLARGPHRRFLWEVLFSIENGEIAVPRGEQTHIAGCAYRALACAAQVLFAMNRRYLINEKGALEEAAAFPITIAGMPERVASIWEAIGRRAYAPRSGSLRAFERELKALL